MAAPSVPAISIAGMSGAKVHHLHQATPGLLLVILDELIGGIER